jgi:6-pyruvoyltetrahydropterin/6-carboxytetrahydropterin synthase
MFELSVETEFCAAHALVIDGQREPVHGHNWHVTVTVEGPKLDPDGLLIDFHALETLVAEILTPFHNRDLNATPPFDRLNPSAENVAQHIGLRIAADLPTLVKLVSVRVTEAPKCSVVYRP